jgi:hypothetical protein
MNQTPDPHAAERCDAMAAAYESWAEPLSARLARTALTNTRVSTDDRVLDIGAISSACRRFIGTLLWACGLGPLDELGVN